MLSRRFTPRVIVATPAPVPTAAVPATVIYLVHGGTVTEEPVTEAVFMSLTALAPSPDTAVEKKVTPFAFRTKFVLPARPVASVVTVTLSISTPFPIVSKMFTSEVVIVEDTTSLCT